MLICFCVVFETTAAPIWRILLKRIRSVSLSKRQGGIFFSLNQVFPFCKTSSNFPEFFILGYSVLWHSFSPPGLNGCTLAGARRGSAATGSDPSDGQTVSHCKAESPWIYDHVSGFSQNALSVRHAVINLLPLTEDEDIENRRKRGWKETMARVTLMHAWSYFHRLSEGRREGLGATAFRTSAWVQIEPLRRAWLSAHCGKLIHSLMPECFHGI